MQETKSPAKPKEPVKEVPEPVSAIAANPKVMEQLTQRFQKYKKDINATLISLYKDTKLLMQNQEIEIEQAMKD